MTIFVIDMFDNLIELNNIFEIRLICDRYFFSVAGIECKETVYDIHKDYLKSIEIL